MAADRAQATAVEQVLVAAAVAVAVMGQEQAAVLVMAQVPVLVLVKAAAMPAAILLQIRRFRRAWSEAGSPNYPSSARSASIEGTTTVRILVGYEGEVESVVVAESSGNAALDAAAVEACYGWRFSGAKNGIGQKIRCYTYVPITFRLRR